MEMTSGQGPDSCIDAVGHRSAWICNARVLREAIMCCRKGGTLSVPGVYIRMFDKVPFGALMNKGLTVKTGQTHVQRYLKPLLEKIVSGQIDPSFVITHTVRLDDAPEMYKTFRDKKDGCIKVVLKPQLQ